MCRSGLKERAEDNAAGIPARTTESLLPDDPYMWKQPAKPLFAAIDGYTLAGGLAIAQMCDLRLATEDARLGITETGFAYSLHSPRFYLDFSQWHLS